MKYCNYNNEREGTAYHEFYKGKWDQDKLEFWRDDSIYVHDDMFWENPELQNLFREVIPEYSDVEMTEVTADNWAKIGELAKKAETSTLDFYGEIDAWAQPVLQEFGLFTILGI